MRPAGVKIPISNGLVIIPSCNRLGSHEADRREAPATIDPTFKFVIARSPCDEAISFLSVALDCSQERAMTWRGWPENPIDSMKSIAALRAMMLSRVVTTRRRPAQRAGG
jgi:hypothetical protein